MLKSHWTLASVKLMLSWLKTEFKRLFNLCIVKIVERDKTSFMKPECCKAHPHVLWFVKCQLESVEN